MNIQRIRIGVPIQNRFSYKVPLKASVIECGRSSSNKGNRFVIIDQFYFFHYASDYIDIFLCTDLIGINKSCCGLNLHKKHNQHEQCTSIVWYPPFTFSAEFEAKQAIESHHNRIDELSPYRRRFAQINPERERRYLQHKHCQQIHPTIYPFLFCMRSIYHRTNYSTQGKKQIPSRMKTELFPVRDEIIYRMTLNRPSLSDTLVHDNL